MDVTTILINNIYLNNNYNKYFYNYNFSADCRHCIINTEYFTERLKNYFNIEIEIKHLQGIT